jgi:hypothetical protein
MARISYLKSFSGVEFHSILTKVTHSISQIIGFSSTTTIHILSTPLEIIIEGMNDLFGVDKPFYLEAKSSYDPDSLSTPQT